MKFFNAGNVTILIGLLMIAYAFYSYFSHWYLRPTKTPNKIRQIPIDDDTFISSDNKINPQISAKIGIK